MARADDYMLTEEERRLRSAKRKRRIVLASIAVVVIAGAALGAKPAGRAIKGWQARRHAQKAFALIDEEKWNDARAEATAAYQLRSAEPEAVRAVARFLSRTRQPQALEFWDQLEKLAPLSHGDLRDEAAIALQAGDETRASKAVGALLDGKHGTPGAADHLLAAQLAARRSALGDAHAELETVTSSSASTNREKLQAAIMQMAISAEQPEWRAAAWTLLKNLASGQDAAGLDALVVLAQTLVGNEKTPDGFPFSQPDLAHALESHPLARAPHKLLAKDLRIRDQPDRRDELIAAAVEELKAAEPAEAAALATWLNGKREFQRVIDAVPVERALQTRDLFLQYADALGGLGRWSELKELIETDRYPLEPVIQKMYLARCNIQLGEKTAAENNWQRALEAARGDTNKLITLAGYAEKNGAIDIARAAYEEAVAETPRLRAAHQGRLRIAQAQRNTAAMHAVLADMLKGWPNDTSVQNDEAYTSLLLLDAQKNIAAGDRDKELSRIADIAERLFRAEPASLPHRTLLALARLKQNRAADALAVYENIQVATQALTPSALAVHAAVLRENGNTADAEKEIAQIPADSLLPEEQALVAAK